MTRLAIGIGCRKGCATQTIVALVREALAGIAASDRDIPPPLGGGGMSVALFTAAAKRDEPGVAEAAAALGLSLVILLDDALAQAAPRCVTRSARIEALTGLPSLAEAAALAGAGPGARLIVARIAGGGATCAIAMSENAP